MPMPSDIDPQSGCRLPLRKREDLDETGKRAFVVFWRSKPAIRRYAGDIHVRNSRPGRGYRCRNGTEPSGPATGEAFYLPAGTVQSVCPDCPGGTGTFQQHQTAAAAVARL